MYDINDCILIRKTNVFPENNIVETPIHGLAYEFGRSTVIGDALSKILREKYFNPDEFLDELNKYNIYFETYRTTTHFTINGVVSNSMYGEFNYPYAIIEPLKYHINDDSLEGLRVEDTYFSDDIKLSKESIILVPEENIIDIEEQFDLTNMNIRTYKGSIENAIKEVLKELNYDFFVVNNHGYTNGLDSDSKDSQMYNFIYEYAKTHNISQARHFTSEINNQDRNRRIQEAEKIDLKHLKFILDSGLVSNELIDRINKQLEIRDYYPNDFNRLMEELINEIGLDKLLFLTNEFNKQMIEENTKRKQIKKGHELS